MSKAAKLKKKKIKKKKSKEKHTLYINVDILLCEFNTPLKTGKKANIL